MKRQIDLDEFHLAKGQDLLPENFPELGNLSAGKVTENGKPVK
jgi:hypothetical protein